MSDSPQHSFAVLAYRESPYIEECIQSLKNQSVQSEIFISTSTPSPYLEGIARKHGLPLLVNRESGGIASDWNFAYKSCTSPYLTLAHQDDVYEPRYTERCLRMAGLYPRNLITFTDYNEIYGGRLRTKSPLILAKKAILLFFYLFKPSLKTRFFKKAMLSPGCAVTCWSVMYNKKNIGDFEFSKDFHINLDWDAWYRLSLLEGDFLFVNEKLTMHRIHPGSQTSAGIDDGRRRMEDEIMFARLWIRPLDALIARVYALSYRSNR